MGYWISMWTKKMTFNPTLTIHKNQLQVNCKSNMRGNTMKYLENTIGKCFHRLRVGKIKNKT